MHDVIAAEMLKLLKHNVIMRTNKLQFMPCRCNRPCLQ